MKSLRPSLSFLPFVPAALASALTACGNPFALPPATRVNVVDSVTIFALTETDVGLPSAYDVVAQSRAFVELGEPFDFAYDIDGDGGAVIAPTGALGLVRSPGIQEVDSVSFDGITIAPIGGYNLDSALTVRIGTVFLVRSRASSLACTIGSVARYGKFRVIDLDPDLRSIRLETLIDTNCGYRGLEPGIPTQ